MMNRRRVLRGFLAHVAAVLGALFLPLATASLASAGGADRGLVQGIVESNGVGLSNYQVSLYASLPGENHQFLPETATRSDLAFNIKLKGASQTPGAPQVKPFGIALDLSDNAWITDNFNNTVSIVSPSGHLIDTLPATYLGKTVLTHPVGNAVDSKGNIWVANSDWLDVPCPDTPNVGAGTNPSITLYPTNSRAPYKGSPFTGGGLTVPWGIAVDGDDSVWVFNFGSIPANPVACAQTGINQFACAPTGISHFCGTNTRSCPAGLQYVGAPISPRSTGYQSNALMRITGGQIDPSGNIWITGNWKINASPDMNPGGNSIAIAIGAAAPVQTPLIGPPVPF